MSDPNPLVLCLVASIKNVTASGLLAPLQNMVEDKFMAGMEDFANQKVHRICILPVAPKGEMNTE